MMAECKLTAVLDIHTSLISGHQRQNQTTTREAGAMTRPTTSHIVYHSASNDVPALLRYTSLGPFHGAIVVPSVTHCRCRRRGPRCAGGMRQWWQ